MSPDEKRSRLLALLYEWKTAPESERAAAKRVLDTALDEARQNTQYSREDLKDLLMATYYRDYFTQRKRAENAGRQ